MRRFWFFLSFILLVAGLLYLFRETAVLQLHFIDVGEGDAILIETPTRKAVLIDTGNLISGFRVAGYLKGHNIRNLDRLIFTHIHPDHIGGSFFALQMFDVNKIHDNGEDISGITESQDIYRWYENLARKNNRYGPLKAEDGFSYGGAVFKVLWPVEPFIVSGPNANSVVVMVEYKDFRCLLTGDLTVAGERELFSRGVSLKADVLKVGHHGSSDANSVEFLKAVHPSIAVISVDKDNIRGYPSGEVLNRLKGLGCILYRTDRDGDIIIRVRRNGTFLVKNRDGSNF